MAKFAPVCPPHLLTKMSSYASGDYHLLLAHDVAARPEEYRKFFNSSHLTVIMDNSVIELGGAVSLDVITKAVIEVRTNSLVLPDVLLNAEATVESCKDALPIWDKAVGAWLVDTMDTRKGFMIVPQGLTIQEWAWCAEQFADDPRINYWGIPRNLVRQVGTRNQAIQIAQALNPGRRIHLLGFSDNIIDDVLCSRMRCVKGIDSAVPIRAASEGKEMTFNLEIGPRGNWWNECEHVSLMDRNIETYRSWIGGAV